MRLRNLNWNIAESVGQQLKPVETASQTRVILQFLTDYYQSMLRPENPLELH